MVKRSLLPNPAASSRVHVPTILCINKATMGLGVDFDALVAAMQAFVDDHVAPVWGTPAKLVKSTHMLPDHWSMVFLDHADHAHALAVHDLTPDGMPLARVFVGTTLKHNELVSVSASHELVEMLVDPSINLVTMHPHSKLIYGYESADPVEEMSFLIDGIAMTNFVYPTYFESFHKRRSVQFDHLNALTAPFEIHAGGYQGVYKGGKWVALFGSPEKKKRFAHEDRRGHRSEQRAASERRRTADKHMAAR
jgi:hypothetical protein